MKVKIQPSVMKRTSFHRAYTKALFIFGRSKHIKVKVPKKGQEPMYQEKIT